MDGSLIIHYLLFGILYLLFIIHCLVFFIYSLFIGYNSQGKPCTKPPCIHSFSVELKNAPALRNTPLPRGLSKAEGVPLQGRHVWQFFIYAYNVLNKIEILYKSSKFVCTRVVVIYKCSFSILNG